MAESMKFTRREVMKAGLAAGAGLMLGDLELQAWFAEGDLITKAIPSSGEKIPVIGLGTNQYGAQTPEEMAPRRAVIKRLAELGGKVIDTAPAYGRGLAEPAIGQMVGELGSRDKLFLATKVTARDNDLEAGKKMLEDSFRFLKTDKIDLMQVHNLAGADVLLPVLAEWKKGGRFRYIGITTSSDNQYEGMEATMKKFPMDFIQVDYGVNNRNAEERIFPLAQEKGISVLTNIPFGGRRGSILGTLTKQPLPGFAAEIGCKSWAQVCLKYNVSHPAVTCAIPGTIRAEYMEDNMGAARGVLPDAAMRKRIEQAVEEAMKTAA
jgi:aryl-alcohol dehydrogenase-like predicted oxidoreductase